MLPEFPLLNVVETEFPVFFRCFDARKKTLALLLFRKVEEELDDTGPVDEEVLLQISDRTIAIVPQGFVVMRRIWETFAAEKIAMHRTISTSS